MPTTPQSERRMHPRELFNTGVTFFLEQAGASYPARTVDLSKGGLLMQVPPAIPAKPGMAVKISSNNNLLSHLQNEDDSFAAQIVRVDRNHLLQTGQLEVAVKFC